jgi:hypothetical protein
MPESVPLPERPSLEQLKRQAKELLRGVRAGDAGSLERCRAAGAAVDTASATLSEAQFVLAREYGFDSWARLKHHVEGLRSPSLTVYEQLAREVAGAYMSGDAEAILEVNWNHGTSFAHERDAEAMRRRLPNWYAADPRTEELALADARDLVARSNGLDGWKSLVEAVSRPQEDPRSAPVYLNPAPPFYRLDWGENRLEVRGPLSPGHWNTVAAVMREHGIGKLAAGGISDAGMAKLARLDKLTVLQVENSKELTAAGLAHLVDMPQLEELEVGGPTSPIDDSALVPLRHLRRLKRFQCSWARGITDAGAANLGACPLLEDVNLMGTLTGDGVLAALAEKPSLRRLSTGRLVTDAGIEELRRFPAFRAWSGGAIRYELMGFRAEPNHLLIDGPFTDAGLERLAGLDGLFGLTFFWHCRNFTAAGLRHLRRLPHLGFLGCQDSRCDDAAMREIAAMPSLRMLMAQGTAASDDGFEALSRSQTIEYIWGRDSANLGGRGFAALAAMPALRGLAVSCRNITDEALGLLPRFASLAELVPMEVSDAGFRHVGRCTKLERLWCMYCRETGDEATGFIAGLPLRTYYAGTTKITDRSLEILARMPTLEEIELWECAGVTNAGVARLAALPNLRKVSLDGLRGVTGSIRTSFPAPIRVNYS